MRLLFIDDVSPTPYDANTLENEALGGSEASLVRVAEGLARAGHTVLVEQHERIDESHCLAHYLPRSEKKNLDAVIVMRTLWSALDARKRFPSLPIYLWCHDWAGPDLAKGFQELSRAHITLVCVSKTHKAQLEMVLAPAGSLASLAPVRFIYNPIDDDLVPDATPVDPNKLVFFSSPHKGLKQTLDIFSSIRAVRSEMTLHIANPGYYKDITTKADGVVVLGPLPHKKAISHVRSSLCVFYPNYVFSETFGLVYAEANAVGTPVMTHKHGAASEVLTNSSQFADARIKKNYIDLVCSWNEDAARRRPVVCGNAAFRLKNVVKQWENYLREHERQV